MAFTTAQEKAPRTPSRREQARLAMNRKNAEGRDLAPMLAKEGVEFYKTGGIKPKNARRKKQCAGDLVLFAKTYLSHVFTLNMSEGQKADLRTMQTAITQGGRYAFAAPRGDGKTSRTEAAILWAMLYGLRRCIVIVGADLGAATEVFESIKSELRINEKLRADFPLPCWAASFADDTAMKAKGWHYGGANLNMRWEKARVILPVLEGADGNGCILVPRGLTGRLRGMRLKVGGAARRPDLFAIDDPQTDESAASPAQVDSREGLVLGAIMGSGGPDKTTAAFMPCTVIKHNDLAARFLDRKRHPDWQGEARAIINTWPDAQKTLWKEYADKRRNTSHEAANEFYRENRTEMDKGAVVDWEERYIRGKELSALQNVENLLCDIGEEVFNSEYMNNPSEKQPSLYELTPELVMSRIHKGRRPGALPAETRVITAATDINNYGLHSVVTGLANDQTGWVTWYGRHDKNNAGLVPKNCPEGEAKRRIYEALVEHGKELASVPLRRDNEAQRIGLWVIDAGYLGDVVRRYISGPARELGIQVAAARGYSADRYRPTGRNLIGQPREFCHLTESAIVGRFIAFCSDYWREISQRAWLSSVNAPGSLSLFEGINHRDFAEQVTREKLLEKLHGQTGDVWKWARVPGWHDYGDAVTMAYVAAAWLGVGTTASIDEPPIQAPKKKKARGVRHITV